MIVGLIIILIISTLSYLIYKLEIVQSNINSVSLVTDLSIEDRLDEIENAIPADKLIGDINTRLDSVESKSSDTLDAIDAIEKEILIPVTGDSHQHTALEAALTLRHDQLIIQTEKIPEIQNKLTALTSRVDVLEKSGAADDVTGNKFEVSVFKELEKNRSRIKNNYLSTSRTNKYIFGGDLEKYVNKTAALAAAAEAHKKDPGTSSSGGPDPAPVRAQDKRGKWPPARAPQLRR